MKVRQELLQRVISRLTSNNTRAMLQKHGKVYTETFAGEIFTVNYQEIRPNSHRMNEMVEGTAKQLGGKVWQYYLDMSDKAYMRLVREAYRRS